MRQRDPLSPEEARELDALERALAGDPVDADLRELEDLVNDIRATAPQMSPGFAASLEHRVAEGFPATDEHPAPRSPRRWILFPAAGALCAALVALVVVLGSTRGSEDAGDTIALDRDAPAAQSGGTASGDSAFESAPAPRASAPADSSAAAKRAPGGGSSTAVAPPPAPVSRDRAAVAPSSGARKVQRNADLVLRVPNAKVESTADGVIRTVDRFGGIVASSQIASEGRHGEASFDLRIPTERLDDALAALSKLGHVAQRSQSLTDITGSFTSAQDRLSDARAERRGLLKALGPGEHEAADRQPAGAPAQRAQPDRAPQRRPRRAAPPRRPVDGERHRARERRRVRGRVGFGRHVVAGRRRTRRRSGARGHRRGPADRARDRRAAGASWRSSPGSASATSRRRRRESALDPA